MPTALQLHLSGAARAQPGPLDVFREARRRFLQGRRLDMQELARDLRISRATLYRWVGDRDQLLAEILWSLAEQGLASARAYADANALDPGVDWVVRFYSHFMEATASFEPIRRFVQAERGQALAVMTSSRGVHQLRLIEALRAALAEKAAAGHLSLRLEVGDLAYVMVRVAESFIWREYITGEEPDLARAAEVARVLLSCGEAASPP
jgi:AcrR family transcriptional regulator